LLEQAWDHRYQKMVRSIRETQQGQGVVCKKEKVDERFGYLEKLINLGAEPSGWLPLLFLNGSSVTTGRRIIVADATPWYCVRAERDPHTLEP
jgi:hypothetical protein